MAAAYMNKGNALARLGKLEEAIAEYNEAIKIRERLVNELNQDQYANDLAEAYMNKGYTVSLLGELSEATKICGTAISLWEESLQTGKIQNLPNLIKTFQIRTEVFIKLEDWQNVGVDVEKAFMFSLPKLKSENFSEHHKWLIRQEIDKIIYYLKEVSPANREKVYANLGEWCEHVKGLVERNYLFRVKL